MAEQWIDAATANLLILEAHRPPSVAGHAICRRALAGLLKARARLLAVGTIQVKDVEVPPLFWEAEGKEGFDQNWGSGDFSSWNPELTVQSRALGVTFALSGVLEMLPFEQRALTARRLSVVGNPAWVPARVAREFAYKQATVSISGSGTAILDHARLGFVAARAVLAQFFDLGKDLSEPVNKVPSWEAREWDVPAYYWEAFTVNGRSNQDWERGMFDGAGRAPHGPCLIKLEGVHFLAESLQALLPSEERDAAGTATARGQGSGGGQPPRAFWDDMLVAAAGLILHGQLTPTRQSQVTDAMLTWPALNGHDISESAVKPKAKKLFEAYEKEGRNFLDGGS